MLMIVKYYAFNWGRRYYIYIGFGYGLLMMFSRLLCGAHYLSDTCMGALLVAIAYYIINEIAYRMGLFNDPKPQEVEQK